MIRLTRSTSTMTGGSSIERKNIRIAADSRSHFVFGANTDVGKTLISAGLVRASALKNPSSTVHYIKPLQCGGSDQAFVQKHATQDNIRAQTIFRWETPASPHTVSRLENHPRSDKEVLFALEETLVEISNDRQPSTTWIETAGGAMSPSSSSPLNILPSHASQDSWGWSTQADLYQPLIGTSPVVLVGDGRLGGISATLSVMESLLIRGYDIAGLVLLETEYSNLSALQEYASRAQKIRSGNGKVAFADPAASIISLPPIPDYPEPLMEWYESNTVTESLKTFNDMLERSWEQRVSDLQGMQSAGRDVFWWPCTRQGNVDDDSNMTLIDSASGDDFQVLRYNEDSEGFFRQSQFDACASRWTQGLGHGDSSLAVASAAAAGRYGHVVFPDAVHAPAINLAHVLISPKGPGHGWADRVFFSDDGSIAMEVSIKMGMKTYQKWRNMIDDETKSIEWTVCAQQDCDHGDTLRAMDMTEPSVFNEGQHPWYKPRGLFLPMPTLGFQNGVLQISFPYGEEPLMEFGSLASVDDAMHVESRLDSKLYDHYKQRIQHIWDSHETTESASTKRRIGSVVIEPILMGSGVMKFVDPLWQRALIDVAKSRRVPVIFDEVTSGLFRVGVCSCREILKSDPDIASYSKLLTGGLLPLGVTLANKDVSETFLADDNGQTLLHGHSFTTDPAVCVRSIHALETYSEVSQADGSNSIRQLFDLDQVKMLSLLPIVQQSFALGTVLAVTIQPEKDGGTGYKSNFRTTAIANRMREQGVYVRPLGNVLYIMASPVTSREECARLCQILQDTLEAFGESLHV